MAEGLGQLAIIKSHTDLKLCVSFFCLGGNYFSKKFVTIKVFTNFAPKKIER